MNKRLLILASAVTLSGSALGLGTAALASADTATHDVSMHAGRHMDRDGDNDRKVRAEARLNQAVTDGTITEAQKTAFEAEMQKLHDEHKNDISSSSTKAERQAERTKLHDELQAWAKANNFPLDKIMPQHAPRD